jgi:16S rRNA processing protein RimM
MAQENLKMIKIANVFHPHGIKGEAELRLLNDDHSESILDEGMTVYLYPASEKSQVSKGGEEWVIQKLRFGNKVICTLEGIKDRTHLETLLPFEIHVPREAFPEPDEDEVYLVDLIDYTVISPEGEKLGSLESFSDNGMQYLFEVRLIDGSKITLPYVEAFFPEIDPEERTITMIMPEYTE